MNIELPHLGEKLDIDARIEEVVKLNFDPDTGAEYWIKYAEKEGLSPKDIDSYHSLHHLGFHDWSIFKDGGFTQLIPKGSKQYFFKTSSSGTTNQKKIALLPESFLDSSNEWWLYNLGRAGLPSKPFCWGVGSPEFWGKNVEHVVKKHNGIFLPVYVESRGAKEFLREQEELKRDGKEQEAFQKLMEKYCPLIEDTGNIFAAMNPNMMVAPAAVLIDHLPLLMGLEPDEPIESLELVISGGDELTPEMYEVLKEKFPNAEIVPYLGHFMLGAAFGRKGLNYFPNAAGTLLDVVDESGETVNYGKKGRVVINFYDTMLWRVKDDVGRRVEPKDDLAWDGVSDISRYME